MIVEQKNTLKFLIRGIREHSDKEMDFVYERLREIHQEILYGNMYEKSEGVLKLWYLNMLGYDISFGFFSIIQVMSFSLFELRRPAFFAAACCFHNKTPMALLCINTFKKILSQSVDNASTCLALSCLGCLRIHDMGRDLHQDVVALLLSSNLSVKHKAILCSYRMIKLFPSTIQSILPKIKDLLNHENSLIVTATISLLLELVQENTVSYLFLVPTLFKCWSHSTSSWQILKLLKLFRIFCSYESRLAPKLQDTITQILNTSSSKSVEYEIFCIVIQFFPSTLPIVSLCLTRLKNSYVNSHDMNLVLMGLEFIANEVLGNPCMVNLLEQIFEHQLIPQILNYVSSSDELIQNYALRILCGCANTDNFNLILDTLLELGDRLQPESNLDFISMLLQLAEKNRFSIITNMEIYVCKLVRMSFLKLSKTAEEKLGHHIKVIPIHFPQVRYAETSTCVVVSICWIRSIQLCESSLPTSIVVEARDDPLENKSVEESREELYTKHKTSLSASTGIIQEVLFFLEDYALYSIQPLVDPQSKKNFSNLVETIFHVGTLEQQRLSSLTGFITEDRTRFSCFVIHATWFLAFENILNDSLRCSALITSIRIFCCDMSQNKHMSQKFLNLLEILSKTFVATPSSILRVISYSLFTLQRSTLEENIQLLHELSDRSTAFHSILTEEREVHEKDDLEQPFCLLSESLVPENHELPIRCTAMKSLVTKIENKKNKIHLWKVLFNDPQIFLFGSFCGPCTAGKISDEDLITRNNVSIISLPLNVRCENCSKYILSNIYLEQMNRNVKVLLAQSLEKRSKKTSLVLQCSKENVLKGNSTVFCRLYYDMQGSSFTFLVPVNVPIYCVLEPLLLDNTSVVVIEQTHRDLLECSATETRHAFKVNLNNDTTLAKYIRLGLSLAHLNPNFHLAGVQETSDTVTVLLTGSERLDPISEAKLEDKGEATNPLSADASTGFYKKSIPLVFVTMLCVVESSLHPASQSDTNATDFSFSIKTTVETNTAQYSVRCASDLADVLVKVFNQQEFIKQRLETVVL